MYVNVGARRITGIFSYSDIPTKKELKALLMSNPDEVNLYNTSEFDGIGNRNGTQLEIGVKYSVTGPNPYKSRKWYATVEKLANGTIKVS